MSATCASCANEYELPPGRGRRSPFCGDCRAVRSRAATFIRQTRIASAQVAEFSLIFGNDMARLHEEVKVVQDGRCAACNRRRRLFLDKADHGLCLDDFMRGVPDGD